MARELLIDQMVLFIKANGSMINLMDKEPYHTKKIGHIRGDFKKAKSMVKEFQFGQTAENTTENLTMTKRVDLEHTNGQLDVYIQEVGRMENNMEKVKL